jgi:N6-L-threonylcarbamoyladenine synthase
VLSEAGPIEYPTVALLVSGGHTSLLLVRDLVSDVELLGETIDDAAGEAFDKIAKALGLGYPGGPALERLAEGGDGSRFDLPRALLGRKDCDFSFSGLKTAASRLAAVCESEQDKADLADAVQTAIARQLSERSDRALQAYAERHDHRLFVVAGGVAANRTIRATLEATAARRGFDFLAPPLAYCTDNAAMIALAGAERLQQGLVSDIDAAARPRWPLDEARARADPTHRAGRKGAKA